MTDPLPSRSRRPLLLPATLAVLLSCGSARADEPNPWYIGAAQTFTYESNLYRIGTSPSGREQTLPAGSSKSDLISNTALVGGIDQTFGRQRAYGSINAGQSVYRDNSLLNTPTYALNLALDWATIEHLSGTLSFGANQSQAKYDTVDTGGLVRTRQNIANTRNFDAVGRMGVVTKLSLEAKFGYNELRYLAADYQTNNYQQKYFGLGVNYRASGLLTLGSALRQTRAEYPQWRQIGPDQFLTDKFTRNDLDFTANWQPSQVSNVSGRLSSTHKHYEHDSLRDSSAPTGNLAWDWQPTGKLKVRTELRRDYGQFGEVADFGAIVGTGVVDYDRTTTTLRLRVDHEISAKLALNAGLQQAHRSLVQSALLPGGVLGREDGTDNTLTLSLGGRWTPTRSSLLGCNLSAERRRTDTTQSTNLNASTFSCFGQLTLQ